MACSVVRACWPHGESGFLVELSAPRAYRHQVRAHLAAVGAPIVGDSLYGGAPGRRHYLHAASLSFPHPGTGQVLHVQSELPQDWPPG